MSKLICIDPGHSWAENTGGDPGACNGDYKESVAALDISFLLKRKLVNKGYECILTRDGGYKGMTLKERCDISNKAKADVFVSIHLNSADNKSASGIEVLRYGRVGKLTEEIADDVLDELIMLTHAKSRGVKLRNDLYVLKHTVAPAILVETGFISNDEECKKLFSISYQTLLADAIANGISLALETLYVTE